MEWNNLIPQDIVYVIYLSFVPILRICEGQTVELQSDTLHDFSSIIIEKKANLTTNEWDAKKKCGGKLYLKVLHNITFKAHSSINLNAKGYKGANNPNETGESIKGKATYKHNNKNKQKFITFNKNYLGGGGSGGTIYCHGPLRDGQTRSGVAYGGGGGGYATKGGAGQFFWDYSKRCGVGGACYGETNKRFKKGLYLGSGGGAGMEFVDPEWKNDVQRGSNKISGGNGGGAVYIDCGGSIIMNEYKHCKIQCNGGYGENKGSGGERRLDCWSGSGSGGSIYIRFGVGFLIGTKCKIEALGGVQQQIAGMDYQYVDDVGAGTGGNGRIYIQYNGNRNKFVLNNSHRIFPKAFVDKNIVLKTNYHKEAPMCPDDESYEWTNIQNRSRYDEESESDHDDEKEIDDI